MNPYKVFFKHIFGANYEAVKKSIFVIGVVFFAIVAAEIKMVIAPSVLFLTATFFSMGVMWQNLQSKRNLENLQGILIMPFENRQLVIAYVLSLTVHALLTKSALVLAIFFAVGTWDILEVVIALVCACNGCLFAVMGYLFWRKAKGVLVLLWIIGYFAAICGVESLFVFGGIVLLSLVAFLAILSRVDAYAFYHQRSTGTVLRKKIRKGNFLIYLMRYILINKNYMINTAGLCVVACVLPGILNQFDTLNVFPIGLAILSLNTPLCILLSVDKDLEQAVRMLPGQSVRLRLKYYEFLIAVNILISSIYLVSWQLQCGNMNAQMLVGVVVFSAKSAFYSVVLEWKYPLRNWKLESDLYHHPRKYIVPAIMMCMAGFISVWKPFVWVLTGSLVVELVMTCHGAGPTKLLGNK